ncbi:sensor histidine kinase [Paenibacillus soyae]|uniref:histidine kinase n=1 Tax=Paenibacillus soyae TaxID=2969249 RepID=A0A9X2SC95_9BACL|nr:histidine kinase [Paenibacillus soyae]MCR2808026.1 histidine kinase [Paenibacillus soyae]
MTGGRKQEIWILAFKSALLLYVVFRSYAEAGGAWYIASILFYMCLELTTHTVRIPLLRNLAGAATILFLLSVSDELHPLLFTLAPMAIYGLGAAFLRSPILLFLLTLAPLPFLPPDAQVTYGFIGAIGFLFQAALGEYERTIAAQKQTSEQLQADNLRLTKTLAENDEYLKQSAYTIQLEERSRLSQEIHDKIGHAMTGALIQMEAAKRLQATDAERSAELLQNAITISKEGIETIRQVLKNMKPLSEQLGVNRMKLFVEQFEGSHGLKTVVTFAGDMDRIEPIHWKIIQQNVTEALTNTVKYAGATSAAIHIEVLRTLVKASVTDNGAGAAKVVKGLGIAGMEERAAAVNGQVIVDGSRGFSVTTLLPFAGA